MAKRGADDSPSLFDAAKARELRDLGIEIVSSWPNDEWVKNARRIAVRLAQINGTVSSDDVQRIFPRPDAIHPNATGAIFHCKELKMVGLKSSERIPSHARRIGVYAYRVPERE